MPLIPRIRRSPRGRQNVPSVLKERESRVEEISWSRDIDGQKKSMRWIHIDQPGTIEMDYLSTQFKFHELNFEDVLSRRQRPKLDEYADHLFVVLHFPRYDKAAGRLGSAELDIFVGPDYLVTCSSQPLRPLGRVFHRCQSDAEERDELFSRGAGFVLYTVLSTLLDAGFPILDKIGHKLDEIEDGIFEGRSKEMVRQISNVKQEIIAYRKIIGPEISTFRMLEQKTSHRFQGDIEVYFDDVIDAGQRIWDILENYKEVAAALEDTNENVVQHGLNDTLLMLTALNAVILPLTFITGLYGMNVALPFQGHEHAFSFIVIFIVAVLIAFVIALRRWRRF